MGVGALSFIFPLAMMIVLASDLSALGWSVMALWLIGACCGVWHAFTVAWRELRRIDQHEQFGSLREPVADVLSARAAAVRVVGAVDERPE
jgi:hypothetical protein